ncbi:MAG TPA: hypothetical protein VGL91_18945 [Acidobacteriota bacterium]|jgi:hypothetical protein
MLPKYCRLQRIALLLIVGSLLAVSGLGKDQLDVIQARSVSSADSTPLNAAAFGPYGVLASGDNAARPDVVNYVTDLGASWVRLNLLLDGQDQNFKLFLDAGINLVLTTTHRDASNVDTTYGTLSQWPNAGFPFKSRSTYQQRITDVLAPVLPYLASGRQLWVQCENEIGDASVSADSKYWRGTTDQYLTQLQALYEVVRSINPAVRVVLTSFTSESLDAVLDVNNPRHDYSSTRLSKLLTQGQYDSADLHFYGCAEDIPAKAKWVKDHMPAGKLWIATEDGGPDYRCPSTPLQYQQNPTKFEQIQAQQVPLRLKSVTDNGASISLWFSLLDLKGETDVFNHLGLVDTYSTPSRKKPAYDAFKSFAAGETAASNGIYFAQFANGGSFISSLNLTNPSSTDIATGTMTFSNDLGQPLMLSINGLPPASTAGFTIKPLGSVTMSTDGTGTVVNGSLAVSSSITVGGVVKFTYPGFGIAGVGAGIPASGFITLVTRSVTGGLSTGVAVASTGSPVILTFTLRSKNGELVSGGQTTMQLSANGHMARFIQELFPNADTREFDGTLTVTSDSGSIVATAIQLGSRPGEFTTLPVTPLK